MVQEDSLDSLIALIHSAWQQHCARRHHRQKEIDALALRLAARRHPEVGEADLATQRQLTRYVRGPAARIIDRREASAEVVEGVFGRYDEVWDVVSSVVGGWTSLTPDELEKFVAGQNEQARPKIAQAQRDGCLVELNRELASRCRPSELDAIGVTAMSPVRAKPPKRRKRGGSSPRQPEEDARLLRQWQAAKSGRQLTVKDFARELGQPYDYVKKALDRARKRK